MDIIKISCPNCGGTVERKRGESSGICPFCDSVINFEAMKEEAEIIRMHDSYEQTLSQQNASVQHSEIYYTDLEKWKKKRTILLVTVFLISFICFLIFGDNGFETMAIIVAIAFPIPLYIAMLYPFESDYAPNEQRTASRSNSFVKHLSVFIKLFLAVFAAYALGGFLAYPIAEYVL